MLKLHQLIFVSLCLLLVFVSVSLAEDITQPLLAEGLQVGSVTVTNDADQVYVTLSADYPWSLVSAAAFIQEIEPDSGDPTTFNCQAPDTQGAPSWTFSVTRLWGASHFFIEAYALLSRPGEETLTIATTSGEPVQLISAPLVNGFGSATGLAQVDGVIVEEAPGLQVTLSVGEGWELLHTFVYAGATPPSKPNPAAFPYKHTALAGAASDQFFLPLDALGLAEGDEVNLAAYVVSRKLLGYWRSWPIYQYSFAWAKGTRLREVPGGPRWSWIDRIVGCQAMYFTTTIALPAGEPVIPEPVYVEAWSAGEAAPPDGLGEYFEFFADDTAGSLFSW